MISRFLLIALVCAFGFNAAAQNAPIDYGPWGLLAIQEGGRRKPIDTFAKESLLRISGNSSVTADGRKWEAREFLLSMLVASRDWSKEPLILIGYKPLVEELGFDGSRKRFSFAELAELPKLRAVITEASELRAAQKDLERRHKEAESVANRLTLFHNIQTGGAFLIVPPQKSGETWLLPNETAPALAEKLKGMTEAYKAGDGLKFSQNANLLRNGLRELNPEVYPTEGRLKLEAFYNNFDPFDWAAVCFGVAIVLLTIVHHSSGKRTLLALGLATAGTGLLIQTAGIVIRCVIAGRPPVTNMYESVIWVSFGTIALGFIFYLRYRGLIYMLSALPVSLISLLLLAQMPVAMPESIDPLVPVLRSNFWLTIHVLSITMSYAVFALAMAFGHVVLWRYLVAPREATADSTLHFWLYRILQLGVLLLAAGTILGGVWANYSWGRFWGWDPKETWALIALLCYIFVLHGRLAGWWNHFGLAVASVLCFNAVIMTWYGVNFVLGKGLHSYGFGIGGGMYVAIFIGLDLAYVAAAALRARSA